ncbi:MAG: CooT family nickel-binding protein [bacterium]
MWPGRRQLFYFLLLIVDIFGDRKILVGKIKKISLLNHKIILEKTE